MDSYSEPIYKDKALMIIIGILLTFVIGYGYLTFEVWMPQAHKDWEKEKSNIDSMSCAELGKYLVKHSTDYAYESDFTTAYKYADAKWHIGDCK